MNPDPSIVDFLCRDENLSLAIDVADAFPAVYDRVESAFLDLMHKGVGEKFNASVLARNWALTTEVEKPSLRYRYAGVYICPRRTGAPHYLYYGLLICRESTDFSVYYGIAWSGKSEEEPKGFPTDESARLMAFLKDREFERNRWNLGYKTFASFMDRKELILSLSQRGKELAPSVVRDFWAFVEETESMMQVTNDSLERRLQKE